MRVLNNVVLDTGSINAENGTFKIRSTTEYPVLVSEVIDGKKTTYYQILSHAPENIDLSRIERGSAPFILGHDQIFKIGTINSVEVVNNSHTVTEVKVADGVKDKIFKYLEDGIFGHGSIGAQATGVVRTYKIDNIPAVVLSWKYVDLSLVSNPADPDASITRSINVEDSFKFTQESIEEDELMIKRALTTIDNINNSDYNITNDAVATTDIVQETDNSVVTEEATSSIETEQESTKEITVTTTTTVTTETVESETIKVSDCVEDKIEVTKTTEMPEQIQRFNKQNLTKDIKMNIFQIAKEIARGNVSEDNSKFVIKDDAGNTYVSNEAIARSFTAGTGVNTAGYADEGGNLIPRDMSADYVKMIYDRFVLSQSGVPFINLSRSCLFPVIESGGTAVWIDENGNATVSDMKTSMKSVKPHYLRVVSDISVPALKESESNISITEIYSADWNSQFEQAIQKAYIKGNPSVDAGSPTGIVTLLTGTPALAATQVKSFVGSTPTFTELNDSFAVLEDTQAPKTVVYVNSTMKAALLSTQVVSGQAVFLATDSGSGKGSLLGRDLFVVPSTTLASDEILLASPASSFVASFHGGMEIISDEKILAGNNLHRFTIRASYDVFFRYPKHFVFMKKA